MLKAFFSKAVRDLNLTRVSATANIGHIASIRILSKLGFELCGQNRDAFGPYNEYVFTSDEVVDRPSSVESLA